MNPKNKLDITDCFLDLKSLAAYSSLSVRTLRDYLADPEDPIPSYSIKRKILVRKSEFDRWIEAHRTDPRKIDTLVDEVMRELQN